MASPSSAMLNEWILPSPVVEASSHEAASGSQGRFREHMWPEDVEYYEMLDRINGLQVHLNPFESEEVSLACARQVATSPPLREWPNLLPLVATLDHPIILAYIHYANSMINTANLWQSEMCHRGMLANMQDMLAGSAELADNGSMTENDHSEDIVALDPSML
ncbi:hypothetical protein SCLCIDRAFT_23699 [Scleroderma citrinum Foug A]|uniref:Uncharacterized protein n=1 Tax=Scleroderma citrinum Foug A TaxID=1036808 RepID=A0A0C3E6J6_9AGAM|nr:hypothetical protein SCLCIDRAFT_23699 [Scleroderma citrinum Foug A]